MMPSRLTCRAENTTCPAAFTSMPLTWVHSQRRNRREDRILHRIEQLPDVDAAHFFAGRADLEQFVADQGRQFFARPFQAAAHALLHLVGVVPPRSAPRYCRCRNGRSRGAGTD